ncbi:MAG: tRNA (guanosine(46)-N(7))-methyltransferase TrmB [Chromatiaceae bacterium]
MLSHLVRSGNERVRRAVRSYVVRGGRLTAAQERAFRELWPRYGVDWERGSLLDLAALFGNHHPGFLEIGFGNGETLAELAERRPADNFLGVEVHPPGIGHLLFPDPWPKKKHHKRRILRPRLVRLLGRVIRPGGVFHAATDWEPYAQEMLQALEAVPNLFTNGAGIGRFSRRPQDRPLTKFEQRGQRLGHEVRDLIFRRV